MKFGRPEVVFQPVQITLESQQEVNDLYTVLCDSNLTSPFEKELRHKLVDYANAKETVMGRE